MKHIKSIQNQINSIQFETNEIKWNEITSNQTNSNKFETFRINPKSNQIKSNQITFIWNVSNQSIHKPFQIISNQFKTYQIIWNISNQSKTKSIQFNLKQMKLNEMKSHQIVSFSESFNSWLCNGFPARIWI